MAKSRLIPLTPNPKLTRQLRVTVSVCAEMMAAHEAAFNAALTTRETRREMVLAVADLANLCEVIRDAAARKKARR
jgi:hypothetical protein